MVIFAVTILVMLFFIGLAVDAGSVYASYGQLKRAIDSAAVSAANNFKRGESIDGMFHAAEEVLRLQNMDMSTVDLEVHICDGDGDGETDADLATISPDFFDRCPTSSEPPRKLVFVQAEITSPLYFLSLLGFTNFPLTSFSIAEAAPVDLVIVLDVSESMGYLSSSYNPSQSYNPDQTCNPLSLNRDSSTGACQPLWNAKDAASKLIQNTLYAGYDRVSVITFDSQARVTFDLTDNLNEAQNLLWNNVRLHDDPYVYRIWSKWLDQWTYDEGSGEYIKTREFLFNPVNPEDRDGDGRDYDNPDVLGYTCPDPGAMDSMTYNTIMADRWWDSNPSNDPGKDIPGADSDPHNWGGVPCDEDNLLDSYDWDGDGEYSSNDTTSIQDYFNGYVAYYAPNFPSISPLSTCTGCGLRMASNELKANGRPGAVWVIVFLSDGDANLSDTAGPDDTFLLGDTPNTGGVVHSSFPNGFCNSELGEDFWLGPDWCKDPDYTPRYCLYETEANDPDDLYLHQADCPSDSTKIWVGSDPDSVQLYSVVDYARDIADSTVRENEVAIYSVGLNVSPNGSGEKLLRYIAWVGDDPFRDSPDPCRFTAGNQACGQYYFATQNDLSRIFDDIASRIYTKISE